MLLPRIEVIEPIVKVEERQVESMADMTAFDDLFGSDRLVFYEKRRWNCFVRVAQWIIRIVLASF